MTRLFAILLLCCWIPACGCAADSASSGADGADDTAAPTATPRKTATPPAPPAAPPASSSRSKDGIKALFTTDSAFAPLPKPGPRDWLSEHKERGQTYRQYVRSHPNPATGTRNTIYLQPIGKFESPALPSFDVLAEYASVFFGLPVEVLPVRKDLRVRSRQNLFSGTRQLLTGDVMNYLKWRVPHNAYALIALTDIDLFPAPDWNFVFGQGSFKERVGVYSFARYHPSFDDPNDDTPPSQAKKIVLRRAFKIMTHELGHMFGIHHCVHFSCLMNGSNHLEEADSQPLHVCPVELRKLHRTVRFDPRERYRKLAEFYRRVGFEADAEWAKQRAAKGGAQGASAHSRPALSSSSR